jgi:hypothetical protein
VLGANAGRLGLGGDVGACLRRVTWRAKHLDIRLAVFSTEDKGNDVVVLRTIAGADLDATVLAASSGSFEQTELYPRWDRRVVVFAAPLLDGSGHAALAS